MSRRALARAWVGVVVAATVAVVAWRQATPAATPAPETDARAGRALEVAGDPPGEAPALACRFVAGQSLAFEFRLDLAVELRESAVDAAARDPDARSASTRSTGELHALILGVTEAGEAIVAVMPRRWRDASVGDDTPGWSADLERPYLARIGPRCTILATARHEEASLLAYDRVLRLLDPLRFALPEPSERGAPYLTRHADTHGTSLVENVLRPGGGRGSISRRRLRFVETLPGRPDEPRVAVSVTSSSGSISLGSGPWFESLDQDDTLRATWRGRTAFDSRLRAHFEARPASRGLFAGRDLSLAHYVWGEPSAAALARARDGEGPEELRGVPVEEAWRRYAELAGPDWFAAQKHLRAWLRANPGGARALAEGMRAGRYTPREQAAIVLAMARSGAPAAEQALRGLAADVALDENLRTQAISALADVPEPSVETVETLARIADREGGHSLQDLAGSAATLSLGTVLEGRPLGEAAEVARAYLDTRLRAGDPSAVAEALWAVGNSGDAGFLDLVEPLVVGDDPELRAAAAHALRKMPRQEAGALLAERVRVETHPEVAIEVVASEREHLARGGHLDAQELNLLRSKLLGASEPLRRELVLTLGVAARHQPEARRILAEWFPNETSLPVKQLIGQYVSAHDLAAALAAP